MKIHLRERNQFLCGVAKPRKSATWVTFFRVVPDQRCPECLRIWREQNKGAGKLVPQLHFDYQGWALDICAGLLDYDLESINFTVVGLPDVEAGRAAIKNLIKRLRDEAKDRCGKTLNG